MRRIAQGREEKKSELSKKGRRKPTKSYTSQPAVIIFPLSKPSFVGGVLVQPGNQNTALPPSDKRKRGLGILCNKTRMREYGETKCLRSCVEGGREEGSSMAFRFLGQRTKRGKGLLFECAKKCVDALLSEKERDSVPTERREIKGESPPILRPGKSSNQIS